MENQNDDIKSFTEFDDIINFCLFDTDQNIKLFQNLSQGLLVRDLTITANEEKIAEIWKIFNIFSFYEQKLFYSILASDIQIKQVTDIVENLEHQGNSSSEKYVEINRVPIYCNLENLFLNICHMQELLESITNDEQYVLEKSDDPFQNTKILINKQLNIQENIQNKLDFMEKQIQDINSIKCTLPNQN